MKNINGWNFNFDPIQLRCQFVISKFKSAYQNIKLNFIYTRTSRMTIMTAIYYRKIWLYYYLLFKLLHLYKLIFDIYSLPRLKCLNLNLELIDNKTIKPKNKNNNTISVSQISNQNIFFPNQEWFLSLLVSTLIRYIIKFISFFFSKDSTFVLYIFFSDNGKMNIFTKTRQYNLSIIISASEISHWDNMSKNSYQALVSQFIHQLHLSLFLNFNFEQV